ncbi:NlpC/P60 family protein [Butyrivibrio sp. AE3009]|uniref:NlpC/P60 family protein n=1 Tax=Butyrivibrio sp. AE3009 TaxID=1280666 RepID=UPI0003B67982|nr:NlpC/P60 family protein [Butyrivibrio sp. AE3009]
MKRKSATLVYGILFGVFIGATAIEGVKLHGVTKASSSFVSDESAADPYEGLVGTVEGTTADMLVPGYWLVGAEDEVLFTGDEIEDFNDNNPAYVEYRPEGSFSNRKLYMYDLPEKIDGDVVASLMAPELIDELRENGPLYAEGKEVGEDYFDEIRSNMGLDCLQEQVIPFYGICVVRSDGRTLPCDDFIAADPEEMYFDELISSEFMPGIPVVILAESRDGEWFFAINGSYCGWVHKDTVALCDDKTMWYEASHPEQFLMVTGSEIILERNARNSQASGLILPMGTKIKLVSDGDDGEYDRMAWGCYRAEVPCRGDDGKLYWERVLIPVSKDVCAGYPEMTSKAVLEQAFKFQGKIYGYGGTLSSNDCSGFVRQVYACFGFELPRNAKAIARTYDLGSIDCTKMTTAKKLSVLKEMLPGSLVFMEGHIMMYLGTKEGIPYVISSCATCIEPGHDTSDIVEAYGVFVSGMNLRRANGNTWLEDMNYILWREY